MSEKIIKVTVGAKAYSFHDQSTGITIARGEERENPNGFELGTSSDDC